MLKEDLSDDRLLHSMAAARTANRLAQIHGLDIDACELAGLLHDCAKCMDLQTLQQIARDHHLKLSDVEMQSNGLLHGPVSAVIAGTKYGIRNPEILTAISSHTTGYAGMTAFDMAIFLADKIEPYRHDIPALDAIRALADVDLLKATYQMLLYSRAHIVQTKKPLHPATDQTIQWVHDRIR
jgi:predicted HD superfamily hydrolase involved in NAD metabolism